MEHLKEQLMLAIEGTSDWRAGKAEEYPEDAQRNENSSQELLKLNEHISELPINHPLFIAMSEAMERDGALYEVGEEQNYLISRYGFHRGLEAPEAFINELTELYQKQ
jgi:hypothetical protein